MPAMDYLAYLQTVWTYLPYILYSFVFLTLLPKSVSRIKSYAYADYEANRIKFHRCYAPDTCCHTLADQPPHSQLQSQPKPKARKLVTRAYPKRTPSITTPAIVEPLKELPIKRQVPPSAIHTRTNVNLMAKMFESGSGPTTTIHSALIGVQIHPSKNGRNGAPTTLPGLRNSYNDVDLDEDSDDTRQVKKSLHDMLLLQENIENSPNLLNQTESAAQVSRETSKMCHKDWSSDSMSSPVQRCNIPKPIVISGGGTSATPSTASPAASSPRSGSPHNSSSPTHSPVLRKAPPLILNPSLEDIFAAIARSAEKNDTFLYAGCSTLAPVTSIDDILSQRRLSRPLSAYSISDLLAEDSPTAASRDDAYVERLERVHR